MMIEYGNVVIERLQVNEFKQYDLVLLPEYWDSLALPQHEHVTVWTVISRSDSEAFLDGARSP